MPKVSVVIPIYRAAQVIERCLLSVLAQTEKDIEVILVDDHGGDESMALAKQVADTVKLPMQFVFAATEQNAGPGTARNVGMKQATGDYILFVDADDFLEPNMVEELYKVANASNAELTYCNAVGLKNPTYQSPKQLLGEYIARLWTCLFKREFLMREGVMFPPYRTAEDSYFIGAAIMLAQQIAYVDKELYHYIVYEDSISHRKGVNRLHEKAAAMRALIELAKEKGIYEQYKWTLRKIYLKKGILVPIKEML